MSEWVREGGREWVSEWVSAWVNEWVSEWVSELSVLFLFCVLWPPINVPTTGQRGVSSTEVEPFGKDEGIDLSVEAGGNIFAYVLLATGESISGQYLQTDNETGPKMNLFFPSIANARSSTYRTEPFGKDEGIDLSVEAGGNIFAYVLHAAQPAARASLVSTCRSIMKQDRRWTCSFPPSQMPGAQPTGKKVPSSLPNQKASSIVTYMTYRPHGDPGFQARWKQSSQKQTLEAVSWKQSSKLLQLELQPRGKSLPWSSCSRRCWIRRRTDLPPAKVGEPSYPLRIL